MQVVGEDAVEADVRVDHERKSERTVEDSRRAVLGESDSDQRYEGDRETALKGPVVRSVCALGLREGVGSLTVPLT